MIIRSLSLVVPLLLIIIIITLVLLPFTYNYIVSPTIIFYCNLWTLYGNVINVILQIRDLTDHIVWMVSDDHYKYSKFTLISSSYWLFCEIFNHYLIHNSFAYSDFKYFDVSLHFGERFSHHSD